MGSKNADYLADTQDGEVLSQQDMFDDNDVDNSNNSVLLLLREIMKEQKELIRKVNELCDVKQKFCVEGSTVERDYVAFLKERFSEKPWIKADDLQAEIRQLLSRAGVSGRGAVQAMHSFAYTKFTQYRNQLRGKLLSNGDKDVEAMSIDSLHSHLWRHFLPPSINVEQEARKRLTLMLRAFTSKKGYFRKAGGAPSYWKEFSEFFEAVMSDNRTVKWERLLEKEQRRIETYRSQA